MEQFQKKFRVPFSARLHGQTMRGVVPGRSRIRWGVLSWPLRVPDLGDAHTQPLTGSRKSAHRGCTDAVPGCHGWTSCAPGEHSAPAPTVHRKTRLWLPMTSAPPHLPASEAANRQELRHQMPRLVTPNGID